MPKPVKFYFGRLNTLGLYDSKRDFLLQGLRTDVVFESRHQRWGYFQIREDASSLGQFITGYLVRFRSLEETEIAQLETHSIGTESIENFIVAKSRFYLHIPSGLIAFDTAGGKVKVPTFIDMFCRVFEEGLQNFFVSAEIQMVEDRLEFFRSIREFTRIIKVQVALHPSNPRNADLCVGVDNRMKAIGATSLIEEIRNDSQDGTLKVGEDEQLQSKFYMAEDGYGIAKVTGTINGETRTISTRNNPITLSVPKFQTLEDGVVEQLLGRFSEIMSRFVRDEA